MPRTAPVLKYASRILRCSRPQRPSVAGSELPLTPGTAPPPPDTADKSAIISEGGEFPIPEDHEISFGEGTEEGPEREGEGEGGREESSLGLSLDTTRTGGDAGVARPSIDIGGLDLSEDRGVDLESLGRTPTRSLTRTPARVEEEGGGALAAPTTPASSARKRRPPRRRRPEGPRRMRKRRRIIIDNDRTELTNDHIKGMLGDTTDIVLRVRVHPADWVPPPAVGGTAAKEGGVRPSTLSAKDSIILTALTYDQLLTRPSLGDDGALNPELLGLWSLNAARVEGKSHLPFRMRGEAGEEQRRERAAEEVERAAEEEAEVEAEKEKEEAEQSKAQEERKEEGIMEDVEMARAAQRKEGEEDSDPGSDFGEAETPGPEFSMTDEERREEEEMDAVPFEGLEEEAMAAEEEKVKLDETTDFAADMEGMQPGEEEEERSVSSFSLGAVNDLEDDIAGMVGEEDEDTPRQEAGDEEVSSSAKWHKHTVRVLVMLKRNMTTGKEGTTKMGGAEGEEADADAEAEAKATQLGYDRLSRGCSRRTAAGVFFELLQLKTWDFLELSQDESYGDITIHPGPRFDEDPPNKK
uniref:Rad21/Rec8-like protein C-terminal eukaryotic domain-containing protein n=1 Tax=Odontella aurita TaxID=265563 RepID=A0A7S4K6T6_9STRA